jgi:hypothetical protein
MSVSNNFHQTRYNYVVEDVISTKICLRCRIEFVVNPESEKYHKTCKETIYRANW